jgi:hypothetical protein
MRKGEVWFAGSITEESRLLQHSRWFVHFNRFSNRSVGLILARSNFKADKRQKELSRKKKKEEKQKRKLEKKTEETGDNAGTEEE